MLWKVLLRKNRQVGGRPTKELKLNTLSCSSSNKSGVLMPPRNSGCWQSRTTRQGPRLRQSVVI
eukprot:1487397-Prorocentrum_lima.AAC.1